MRVNFLLLLILLGTVELLNAQRTQQPDNPVITGTVPVSSRFSYSTAGRDSLRVELINVDVPGLEIISCEKCTVQATWFTTGAGSLDVVVKNRGAVKSNTATVWVEYGAFTLNAYGGFKKINVSARKGVPVLAPGQTTKLTFAIQFNLGDVVMKNLVKGVRATLTQNGGRAWQGSN